jgi:Fis family transcriptional regulator, factor for inversion stimulation protein
MIVHHRGEISMGLRTRAQRSRTRSGGVNSGSPLGVLTMTARKKTRARESATARVPGRDLPLRNHAERALSDYFSSLNGHRPAHLYDLVLREVEEPLFRVVLDYAEGNQSRAAGILGINRGTLRKKLRQFGLAGP